MNEIVLGSFFGDEGKGQTVHNLCKTHPREEKAVAVTKAQQEFEVAELEAKKAKQVALKVKLRQQLIEH